MIIFIQLIKKNLEETEKKFACKEYGHFNEVGRKIIFIFLVLIVLPKIKLWI